MTLEIPSESLLIDLSANPPKAYSGKKLSRLVDAVAGKLHSLNLSPDVSIGILGTNSVRFVIAMLGTHKTNHVCIPLNYKMPKDKLDFCINDSRVGLVFCDAKFKHLVPQGITTVEFESDFAEFTDHNHSAPVDLDPNRLCLALYTSGSTGVPKKILFNFQDRFSETVVEKMSARGAARQRTMTANPLFHNAGINWFVSNLIRGNTVFVPSHFDAKEFLKDIQKNRITSLSLVPPMMSMMLNETELLKTVDLSSVKGIVFQAGLADASLLQRVKQVFVNVDYIVNPYVLTETGLFVFGEHPNGIKIPPGSVGHSLPSVRTKLIDSVLYVKTEDLFSRLQENSDEYFNTRDRFRVDEQGFYYYIGRADDMLKCSGEKVYPIEIEQVLNQHPAVVESVIIGLDDEIKGQKPYAFVKVSTPVEETNLLNYASSMLATYQIPKRIWVLDNFPINEIGKMDKKTLCHWAEQNIKKEQHEF
jgi:acyl-CoA synthetase (AMP-forming)/AMP-acid ligase II